MFRSFTFFVSAAALLYAASISAQDSSVNSQDDCAAKVGDTVIMGTSASKAERAKKGEPRQVFQKDIRCELVLDEANKVVKVTPVTVKGSLKARSIDTREQTPEHKYIDGAKTKNEAQEQTPEHKYIDGAKTKNEAQEQTPEHKYIDGAKTKNEAQEQTPEHKYIDGAKTKNEAQEQTPEHKYIDGAKTKNEIKEEQPYISPTQQHGVSTPDHTHAVTPDEDRPAALNNKATEDRR